MRKFTLLLTLLLAFMTTAIAQIDTSKEYRVKHTTTGKVMNASNYDAHPTGPLGGVNFVEEAESDDQVFLFEADGSGYKLKTKSGKYIYCQAWNVDALDQASTLTFSNNGDGTYKIGCDKGYFKVENVTGSPVVKENGVEVTKEQVSGYFPFCDAGYTAAANFELVEVEATTPEVPEVPAGPVVITDVAQLSNAKCYTLVSSDTGRGGMYALADKVDMCGVTHNAGTDACHSVALDNADPKQQFAFVEYEGKLYLYSVSEKKFVMKSGDTNALVGEAPFEHVVVEKVGENTFALQANGTHYFTASPGWCANPSRGTCVQSTLDSHSSDNGWDNGAWYTITEVADFDATEALAMLAPATPLELVSVKPADGSKLDVINNFTFVFNKPVTLGENGGVVLYYSGSPVSQLMGEVSADDPTTATFSYGEDINKAGKYMLYVAPETFVDADGNTNEEMMLNYVIEAAINSFELAYSIPAVHQVQKSLKTISLGFIGSVGAKEDRALDVVDEAGEVVTTATMEYDDFDFNAIILTLADELVYTGKYSITIPEGFVTSSEGTYNPEFTLTYTVEGIEKPKVIGTPIKEVAELKNNYLYTVVQANHSQGATSWAVATGGAQFVSNADIDPTLEAGKADDARQQFAFISHEGTMYLYHAAEQKFVNKDCTLGEMPLDPIYFKAGAYANTFFAYFDEDHHVNVGGSRQMCVDGWNTADGGNSCTITPVAEFDPTEVLKKFETPEVDEATLAAIEKAEGVLAKTGVGYPAAESTSRTALVAAVEEAKAAATTENGTKVNAALATYLAETDVTLPETGKAYTFTMVAKNGNKFYLNYTGQDVAMVAATGEALPESAKFVATANGDGTYTFQTNDGNYLVYHSKYAGVSWLQVASTTGFQAEKDDMTNITLAKLSKGGNVAATDEQVFGLVSWYSMRGVRSDNGANEMGYMVLKADGSDYDGATAPFWNDNYSSAFLVEEAEVVTPEVPALELASKYTATFIAGGSLEIPSELLFDQDLDGNAKEGFASLKFVALDQTISACVPYETTATTVVLKGVTVGDGSMSGQNKEVDIVFTVQEDGSLLGDQKIWGNTWVTSWVDLDLTTTKFVPATETPATPLELVSVDPADGAELESVSKFTFTFNKPVTLGEEGGVVLYVNGMPAGQLWGEVSEEDAKVVTFVTEKEISNSGKYMLYVAPATFVDADGNTNEEMMLNYQVKAAVNSFTYAYVTPAQHQVQKSLKVLTIGFIGEVQDVVSSKSINVVDAEGKTVTTAKLGLDDYDWNAVIVTFKDEITAPGQYSITIPEEYVFSFEQTYNPEFTLTFTIEGEKPAAKPLEIVSVDPAKGSVIEKFDMVKVTFNQEVRVNKMFGAEYFFNGTYIADAGVYVDPTDSKTVIIDTQGEYKNKGTWGFSVQQGTIVTLDGTECESFELTYEVADITGINGIFAEHKNDVYTLDGRKVVLTPGQKIKKGLYIVGGKKVLVK